MIRNLLAALIVCGIVVFSFFQFYHFLKGRIATSNLKAVTEKRIGAFLKAPVHVDRISVGLLKHISLSGLSIKQTQKGLPFLVGVKKIVVRYDLASFLKRNFRIPTEIFLDSPSLTLKTLQSFGALFDANLLRSDRGILTRFEFEQGELELPWFRSGQKLRLAGIEGQAIPKKGDLFDVRFKSHLADVASGSVLAYGEVDPNKKQYHLEVALANVALSEASQIPITHLNGTIEIENDVVRIRKAQFLLRGIPCEVSGEIENVFSEKPVFALSFELQEGQLPIRSDIRISFKEGTVSGTLNFTTLQYQFSGSVMGEPSNFQIDKLLINNLYQASAGFDLKKGTLQIEANRKDKARRLQLNFSLAKFDWQMAFKIDHLDLFGFDLVTYAIVNLKPFEETWQKGTHIFEVDIATEYLIFQHEPLRDFKASAKISTEGITDILAHWGNVSELRGKISFGRIPEGNLTLQVGPLPLTEVQSFGAHPLPLSFDGILEGKLDVTGALEAPNLLGAFTISKGTVGSLQYDQAIINFSGQLPYLVLKDSKIRKGKNNFMLKGGFDFRLHNIFEGVQVDNFEHIIIWKGLELSSELQDSNSPTGRGASGRSRSELKNGDANLSKVEAEYKLGERTSLNVTAEEDQAKKEYLTAGPKIKF